MQRGYQGYYSTPEPNTPQSPSGCPMNLAEAYIPFQKYTQAFSPMEALKQGTLFPELVRPYVKKR